jgi:hypothetical protein
MLAALTLSTGSSMLGDTPDTRDSTDAIAQYFLQHRSSVFLGSLLMTVAFVALTAIAFVLAEQIEDDGRQLISQLVPAAAMVTLAVYLIAILLSYLTLSYVIGAEAPGSAKAIFELTLVATLVISWPLAALVGTVGIGLARCDRSRTWFLVLSTTIATVFAAGTASFAHDGWFSPDVQQQVVFSATATWLLAVGLAVRSPAFGARRRLPSEAPQRRGRAASAPASTIDR